jgi:RNA polymerase sigma-70 factor (ECF subfamily)
MEKLIIEKLKQGNQKAFKYVFDRYYVLLCRFANQMLNDTSLAEEIVDDAIFYLWEHRKEIEITYSIRAYLMRAVRNRCLNELNSLSHRAELNFSTYISPENMEFLETLFKDDDHPLGTLLEHELEDELICCIESLPEECRRVFKKSRFEQKKYEEIAEELHISVNTVKYHIKNALAYINSHLADYLKIILAYIFMGN